MGTPALCAAHHCGATQALSLEKNVKCIQYTIFKGSVRILGLLPSGASAKTNAPRFEIVWKKQSMLMETSPPSSTVLCFGSVSALGSCDSGDFAPAWLSASLAAAATARPSPGGTVGAMCIMRSLVCITTHWRTKDKVSKDVKNNKIIQNDSKMLKTQTCFLYVAYQASPVYHWRSSSQTICNWSGSSASRNLWLFCSIKGSACVVTWVWLVRLDRVLLVASNGR